MKTARRTIAVVPDLFFATRIAATARVAAVPLELVAAARATAMVEGATLAIVDLQAPGAVELVAALKATAPAVPVVGFFSHVETDLRRRALEAGADAVLPRSRFVNVLSELLTRGMKALRGANEGGTAS